MSADMEQLMQRYIDGMATGADMYLLNGRLRGSQELRREFAALLNMDSALAAQAAGWEPARTALARRFVPAPLHWLALAAALALAGFAWWWQDAGQAFAAVSRGLGADGVEAGQGLRSEVHEITRGTVEFVTRRGARVVVEAPARFFFESPQKLHLSRGRIAAEVPPSAHGFTIVTPTGRAVDLGTKFGVDVAENGAAQVHVFQGQVITQPMGSRQQQSLRGGEAVALQAAPGAGLEMRSAAFIRPEEVASLGAGLAAGQRARAEAKLAELRQDPALVALLDFETGPVPGGTYHMVQGRWPGSHAPEFVEVGDHMKLDVGGEHEWPQLTLAAWVRLDRLGAPYQSLYHTDGWDLDKPGQVHWIINRDSTMRLALQQNVVTVPAERNRIFPDSSTPVLPEQGRWVHLAVVYDATARSVRFYLNGSLDKTVFLAVALPARLGPAQIGNWNRQDRRLSGRVDEFLILGRAMSDDEVRALHAAGTPYL